MAEQTVVSIDLLRALCVNLLDHVQSVEGPEVRLDKDYYWSVPVEQLYDVYSPPTDLTIGQLSECLTNLERLRDDPSKTTSYALVWLADLIRAVGQAVVR